MLSLLHRLLLQANGLLMGIPTLTKAPFWHCQNTQRSVDFLVPFIAIIRMPFTNANQHQARVSLLIMKQMQKYFLAYV